MVQARAPAVQRIEILREPLVGKGFSQRFHYHLNYYFSIIIRELQNGSVRNPRPFAQDFGTAVEVAPPGQEPGILKESGYLCGIYPSGLI
jgi:hypothetical protein